MEIWKDIKGFEGVYQVSDHGRIKRVDSQKIRTLNFTHDGYVRIRLIHNGKDETRRVHRLVAEAFIPNPDNKETVNHIDGNKRNNNVSNLEWADRHEQMIHAYEHGLKKAVHTNRKLSDEQVAAIRKEYVPRSKEHGTVALGKKYGVTDSTIGMIIRGIHYA